jgi:hypothetical protein
MQSKARLLYMATTWRLELQQRQKAKMSLIRCHAHWLSNILFPFPVSPLKLNVKRSLSSVCADLHWRGPVIRHLKYLSHLNALDSTLEQGL